MIEKNKDQRPEMAWKVMDITDMSEFATDSFDLAIDKSTIDALLCGDDYLLKVALMLKESQRVLKPGGHYFAISYGKPESRVSHFIRGFLSWDRREFILYEGDIETEEEKEEKSHWIYVNQVRDDANEISEKYFDTEFKNLQVENEYQKLLEMELENEKLEQEQIEEVKETREEFKARIKGCLSSRGSKNQLSEERKEE